MSNMFRIMKSVGSPSVEGAIGVETLASHTSNPEAHPDYLKKGAYPRVFSESEHLVNRLAHAADLARRTELVLSKMDYEKTKSINLALDANNYMATSGVKRHIITAYVLNQILEGFGLVAGRTLLSTDIVVGTSTVAPSTDMDNYVVSYGLFLQLKRKLDDLLGSGLSDVYLKKVDAAKIYTKLETFNAHNHDVMSLHGMPGVMNFGLTYDPVYKEGTTYYKYNSTTYQMERMFAGSDYVIGNEIPSNKFVFEEYGEYTHSMWADMDAMKTNISTNTENIASLAIRSGYALTTDTTVVPGVEYYIVSGDKMTKVTTPSGSPVAKNYWCKIKNNAGTEALAAKIGYALTTDTSRVPGVTYYRFDEDTNEMSVDTSTRPPAASGLFVKVTNINPKVVATSGYALTADTAVVSGVTYYAYNSSLYRMEAVASPTGNPQNNGWYVKTRNTSASDTPTYDDAELRAKSGYALTVDTTPVSGITYYYYDTSGSTKKMTAYSPAPTNPAGVGAWTKIKNVTPSGGPVDLTELTAKAPYAESLDATRVEGVQYFVYNSSTGKMVETSATTRPSTGWWTKIDNATGKTALGHAKDLTTSMHYIAPDWSSMVDLTVTKSTSSPVWTTSAIPTDDHKTQCGTFHLSLAVNCTNKSYGVIEVSDPCMEGWVVIQNIISFHTYSNSSAQHVIQANITVRALSGQKFRFRVCNNGTTTTSSDSGCTVRTDSKLLCYFVPDYAPGYLPYVD